MSPRTRAKPVKRLAPRCVACPRGTEPLLIAQCDGQEPCRRCTLRREASLCVYEAHIKQKKQELLDTILHLRVQDENKARLLDAMRHREQAALVLDRLAQGESYESIGAWLRDVSIDDDHDDDDENEGDDQPDDHSHKNGPGLFWTPVTSDDALIKHLLELYFSWVHPVHPLFNRQRFLRCYWDRTTAHCSHALVNLICAVGCQVHPPGDEESVDVRRLEDAFVREALRSLGARSEHLTTLQALAAMFLYKISHGAALEAHAYLDMAMDRMNSTPEPSDVEDLRAWSETFRGIWNLDRCVPSIHLDPGSLSLPMRSSLCWLACSALLPRPAKSIVNGRT